MCLVASRRLVAAAARGRSGSWPQRFVRPLCPLAVVSRIAGAGDPVRSGEHRDAGRVDPFDLAREGFLLRAPGRRSRSGRLTPTSTARPSHERRVRPGSASAKCRDSCDGRTLTHCDA